MGEFTYESELPQFRWRGSAQIIDVHFNNSEKDHIRIHFWTSMRPEYFKKRIACHLNDPCVNKKAIERLILNPKQKITDFDFMLNVGKISDLEFVAARKEGIFNSCYNFNPPYITNAICESELKRFEELIAVAKTRATIRVWVSRVPDILCEFFHLIHCLQGVDCAVVAVELCKSYVDFEGNKIQPNSFSQIAPQDLCKAISDVRELSIDERDSIAKKWDKLKEENGDLRIIEKGEIVSKSFEYLDQIIDTYSLKNNVSARKLIFRIMRKTLMIDSIIGARLEQLIALGKYDCVKWVARGLPFGYIIKRHIDGDPIKPTSFEYDNEITKRLQFFKFSPNDIEKVIKESKYSPTKERLVKYIDLKGEFLTMSDALSLISAINEDDYQCKISLDSDVENYDAEASLIYLRNALEFGDTRLLEKKLATDCKLISTADGVTAVGKDDVVINLKDTFYALIDHDNYIDASYATVVDGKKKLSHKVGERFLVVFYRSMPPRAAFVQLDGSYISEIKIVPTDEVPSHILDVSLN
ncbi:MAG: DUF3658 domain-containing protein [Clostridia bacterium]